MVRQRNTPHFRVVFGGNDDFHPRRNAGIDAAKISFVFGKRDRINLRLPPNWLMTRGPNHAAAHVAEINEGAPVVARHVFTPTRNGKLLAVRITRTGGRAHYV